MNNSGYFLTVNCTSAPCDEGLTIHSYQFLSSQIRALQPQDFNKSFGICICNFNIQDGKRTLTINLYSTVNTTNCITVGGNAKLLGEKFVQMEDGQFDYSLTLSDSQLPVPIKRVLIPKHVAYLRTGRKN